MTNWYYAENEERRGPISEQELDALIAQGIIKPETLVWQPGMAEWKPLREINRVPELPEEESATEFSDANESQPTSPLARAPLTTNFLSNDQRTGPAWEQRATLGFFKALWQTIVAALTNPAATFATMKRTGGLLNPWLFSFITSLVAVFISDAYGFIYSKFFPPHPWPHLQGNDAWIQPWNQFVDQYNQQLANQHSSVTFTILVAIIGAAISPFISAGMNHLFLMLWGGANRSFETTFRVMAYAFGSTRALMLIPFFGVFIGTIWAIVLMIIGLAKAHDTTTGKAAGAVLTPLLLCCCCVGLAIAFGISAAMQSGH